MVNYVNEYVAKAHKNGSYACIHKLAKQIVIVK